MENETQKILLDFELRMDHLFPARKRDQVIINKKEKEKEKEKRTCRIVDFAIPGDQRMKIKENEKKDNYLDLAREIQKVIKQKSDGDTCWTGFRV